uniref:Laminin G domain-containing protein n=1 Tax=Laticauda laticaudata TaxID=8630 RepID=A0A8C5WMZ0_LATLA
MTQGYLVVAKTLSETSLKLCFQTSRPDGLLFLASGKEDYFLVELNSGNIQVRINFRTNEQILRSQLHSQLDDLEWHLLEIHHERENITLVIDKNYQTSAIMPDFLVFELNIEYGLYIGGRGILDIHYLNSTPINFRGCINDVIFNNRDILSSLKSSARNKNIHEVSLSCSNEFFAGEEESLSFFSSKSYVSFPLWNIQAGGILEYSVQTTAQKGLLIYSSGPLGDFVAMEIENGLIKAHIRIGKNRLELSSLSPVNDNQWHVIRLTFSIKYVELTLEKKTVKTPLPSHCRLPVLKGALYVGGINDAFRTEVRKQELASVSGRYREGGSFRGCLKDLVIGPQKYSLKNVLVTKDISVGCTTPNFAPEKQAMKTASPISVVGTIVPKLLRKESHDHFLFVNDLIVSEGGQTFLGSKHIKVSVDFKALGIRQSQIFFRIKQPPSYGQLRLNVVSKQEDFTFSMLDLWQGKVLYTHNGSEENYDYFTFSVFTSSKRKMPLYLKGNDEYMFTITVRPVNDAPELIFPNGNLLLLLEHSKKCLSIDLVNIVDNDTNAADISITALGNSNADVGFLENSKTPGKTITTFSYEDLQHGNIFFVHTGVQNSRIVLRASDGEKVSNTVVLRVMAVPLDYKLVNNTGIDVLQGTPVLITLSHLATEINSFQQELEVRYEITEEPFFGEIQRKHTNREWKKANSFSQRSIERGRVRYLSSFKTIQQDNVHEHFKFKIIISSNISQEFLFAVRVKWLTYNLLKYAPLVIDKSDREYLNSNNLLVVIPQIDLSENEFLYQLQSLPEKGRILLDNVPLQINSSFSQHNISDCRVEYQLYRKSHEESLDSFRFFISTQYVVSNIYDFKIKIKTNPQNIILINNGLTVTEGEGSLITKSELFVHTFSNMTFEYKVTKSPQHGKLMLINFSDSPESNNNLSSFTNQDIYGERLMYIHDDSETQCDEIHITATAIKFGEEDLETEYSLSVEIKFNISIHLKNDEKPVRVVDKVFHIVQNGRKLLTLDDLCYHDPDTDFDDNQLLYTRRGIPNGDLVLVNETSSRLYQFKQKDLLQKQVLFVHRGATYGRFVLFVTDGKHYTSSLLEVSASEPYVILANNTGLLIQKGKEAVITTTNLSATTNQDIRSDYEIRFEIFFSPNYGQIFVNNLAVATFTQHDLKMELVTYRHDDSNNLIDTLNFTVYAKGFRLDAEMKIQIYLESHQCPPVILHNHSLLVEEGKPVQISNGNLLAVHENSSPSEIEFKVRSSPVYGYLWKFTSNKNYLGAEENPILSFTQQDINDGIIQYIQTISNQLQDHFSLDVTNGIQTVSGIEVTVDILPKLIPIEVHNFTVSEGGSKVLEEDILKISNSHFAEVNCHFSLVEPPKHGRIANSHFLGMALTKFTRKQGFFSFVGAVVQEGSKVLIDKTKLDGSNLLSKLPQTQRSSFEVWYEVIALPQHGRIVVGERNITRDKPHFSQYIINKFGITYVHDDSESLTDHFIFAVWLNEKSKSTVKPNIDVLEEAFNITVVPVNDQVPKLQSKLLCLNVLQGDRKVLGQDNLNVNDLDNSPEEIKYTIITDPQNGHLALWTRLNESIKNFTQADINDGSVWFVQDGSPFSGVFYFSVTDGQHRPQYKLFQLDVIPVSITLINLTEVVLLQGQDRVAVTNVHLSAVTNGKNPEIRFEVTKPFRYGNLLIGNEQVTTFHQRDLHAARLLYCMADFTAFGDMLEFAVFSSESNLTGQVLKISVQPLLQMALNVTVPNRMSYQLNPSYLDATQLATLTKSNPQFEVIMSPVHGNLSRRSLSNAENKSLVLFTKRDIDMGVIYLETNANMTNTDVLNDSFSFILRADHVQPAIGEFHFVIVRQDPSLVQVFTPEVPFLTTADILESYITENEHVFIPKDGAYTDVPAQTFRPDQNHWEHQKDTEFDEDNTRGISVWAVTTIKTQSESTWLLTLSSRNWLIIIVPLSSVAALFIIIAIVLCIFLMCHRSKKAKPLILEQPPVILNSSSFSAERSLTIPTVTVTPLLKSMDKASVLPFISLQREQSHPMPAAPDPAVSLLQSTWSSLDPEIIQHCRKTHPTLKCNQYWV